MALKQVLEIYELLDSALVTGGEVASLLTSRGLTQVETRTIAGDKGTTDFIRIVVPGEKGKSSGGNSPTLGLIGRLGGIGARPERVGLVSDADGAVTALSAALKLADMRTKGDILPGDVIIATHICPHAPTQPHHPVPFMASPVETNILARTEVSPEMNAILSIDTTKGNRVINSKGFAISPTVKEGYILRVSEDLLDIMEAVTGRMPSVFALTTQDITPYGNSLFHLNSIMQPAIATHAPVVGVALTTEVAVAGCSTGASHVIDIEMAVRFCLEVAKAFGKGACHFYDEEEFPRLVQLYGSMGHLQTLGRS